VPVAKQRATHFDLTDQRAKLSSQRQDQRLRTLTDWRCAEVLKPQHRRNATAEQRESSAAKVGAGIDAICVASRVFGTHPKVSAGMVLQVRHTTP
jgi:hypothetical protein